MKKKEDCPGFCITYLNRLERKPTCPICKRVLKKLKKGDVLKLPDRSLTIDPDKEGRDYYFCTGCGAGFQEAQ